MTKVLAIIVAAGSGTRFGSGLPKQFCTLGSRSVLDHAVGRICRAASPVATVVVVSPGFENRVPDGCIVAYGGDTRCRSVANALSVSAHIEADVILVHDGARPLPTAAMIRQAVEAARTHHGAIPVVAVTDTLRRRDGTPADRADFCRVQTPQAFSAPLLRQAYESRRGDGYTDDASVMTAAGHTDIVMTEGSEQCIKITHPMDLEIAALYLRHES